MQLTVLAALAALSQTPPAPAAPAPVATPAPAPVVVTAPTPKNTWVIVAADPGAGTAYDAGSIQRAPDGSSAFISTLIASRLPLSHDGKPVHYLISTSEYDCKAARRREGAVLGLDAAGRPVESDETPGPWQAIASGAMEESYRALACDGATPNVKIAEGPLKQIIADFQKRFAK